MKTKRNGSKISESFKWNMDRSQHVFSCFGGVNSECSRFFWHTAERLANRRKEPKSKISAWIKARLNFALIQSMLLCLGGTRTPSNVDNISEIDPCVVVAESNIEWISDRFISCYFMIINMYMVTYSSDLFLIFFVFIPSHQCYGTYFSCKIKCMFYI